MRLQLVELEDLPWWPSVVRDLATDYLRFVESRFRLHRPMVPLLADALRRTGTQRVIDLCSGGGGPVPSMVADLRRNGVPVTAVLTDRYPNASAFARVAAESNGAIAAEPGPVDARAVPPHLIGLRTICNAFHHFAPKMAVEVLSDARRAGQPIAVFEIPQRSARTIIPLILTPIFVLLATPFIRPFRWARLFWTYLVPLVPITCWWDGLVSQLRAYEPEELLALADRVPAGFEWKAGRVPIGVTPGELTYLIGMPLGRATNR